MPTRNRVIAATDTFTDFGWQSSIDANPAYYARRAEAFLRTYAENVAYEEGLKAAALAMAAKIEAERVEELENKARRGATKRQLEKIDEEYRFDIAWAANGAYLADIAIKRLARMRAQAVVLAANAAGW